MNGQSRRPLVLVDRGALFGGQEGSVERIAPGFFSAEFEREHLARYEWASRHAHGRILDAACGTGYGTDLLSRTRSVPAFGTDISQPALVFGASRYALRGFRADIVHLPLLSASFQSVVCLETLEHLLDPAAFLREVHRILVPAGSLILSTPNGARTVHRNPYHRKEFGLDELLGLLRHTGFTVKALAGQHWQVHQYLRRVWGIRRLASEIERLPHVIRRPFPGAEPETWCMVARRQP